MTAKKKRSAVLSDDDMASDDINSNDTGSDDGGDDEDDRPDNSDEEDDGEDNDDEDDIDEDGSDDINDVNSANLQRRKMKDEDLNSVDYYRIMRVVKPADRVTSDIMTTFEYAEVVGIRATEIAKGSKIFTDTAGLTDTVEIAKKEIFDRRCPLTIIRRLTHDLQEEIPVNELGIPIDVRSNF